MVHEDGEDGPKEEADERDGDCTGEEVRDEPDDEFEPGSVRRVKQMGQWSKERGGGTYATTARI